MVEPGTEPAAPNKGGSIFKKKVAGIPMPVILVVAGVGGYYVYKKYAASKAAASTSSTATPTASSGTDGTSSGDGSGGGGYGGGWSTNPNNPASLNYTGTTPATHTTDTTTPVLTTQQQQVVTDLVAKGTPASTANLVATTPAMPNGSFSWVADPNNTNGAFFQSGGGFAPDPSVATGATTGTGSGYTGTGSTGPATSTALTNAEGVAAKDKGTAAEKQAQANVTRTKAILASQQK